jgi:hypothetical protein
MEDHYKKSIEALNKFLKETPPEEIKKMVGKIEGPTISEYFKQFNGIQAVQKLQDDIKKWSDEAFGIHRTGKPIAHHLKKEVDELIDALADFHQGTYAENITVGAMQVMNKRERILMESVDCFTLLLDILAHEGFNVDHLIDASHRKLEINKKRKWGKPDENGVFEHIEE